MGVPKFNDVKDRQQWSGETYTHTFDLRQELPYHEIDSLNPQLSLSSKTHRPRKSELMITMKTRVVSTVYLWYGLFLRLKSLVLVDPDNPLHCRH